MNKTIIYLDSLRNDVFKLLPMKEDCVNGADNHIQDYLNGLIVSSEGAIVTFGELGKSKSYIYVLNNLNYIANHLNMEFNDWRKIILGSTSSLTNLIKQLNGGEDYGRKEK